MKEPDSPTIWQPDDEPYYPKYGSSCFMPFFVVSLLVTTLCLFHLELKAESNIDLIDAYVRNHRRLQTAPSSSDKLVCYFSYPSYESDEDLYPASIDPFLCTHINVFFASVKNMSLALNPALERAMQETVELKKTNRRLKVLLSVGGANDAGCFSDLIQNHTTRMVFVRSVRDTLAKFSLDGLDIDWEFPVINEDKSKVPGERRLFTMLLLELRREFDRERRNYILSVAVAAQQPIAEAAYDIAKMNEIVDYVNVMSYDFHFYTKATPFTGLNSPLYPRRGEVLYLSTLNINYTVRFWLEQGMSREKMVIGLPTYGHSFKLVNPSNDRLGSPAKAFGDVGELGFVDFFEVCRFVENYKDAKYVFDNETLSPYVTYGSEWISFDNEDSLRFKTKFIRNGEFGGVMVYSLNSDDFTGSCGHGNFSLTKLMNEILFEDE